MKYPRVLARLVSVFVVLKLIQALIIIFVPSQFDNSSRLLLEKYSAQKMVMVTFHTPSPPLNHVLSLASKWLIERYLEKLVTWDAVYFSDLFVNDLQYEHQFVFCPLWWRMVRWIPVNEKTAFYSRLIFATLLSNVFHFAAAVVFYYYTYATFENARIFSSRRMAMAASVLFICSPAAAFMTAPYSESAASFFSFTCLYMREVSTQAIAVKKTIDLEGEQLREVEKGREVDRVEREFDRMEREFDRVERVFNREKREFNREKREFNREKREFNREKRDLIRDNRDLNKDNTDLDERENERELNDQNISNQPKIINFLLKNIPKQFTNSPGFFPRASKNSTLYILSGFFAAFAFGLRANCLLLGLVYLYDLYALAGLPKSLPLVAGSVLGTAFAAVQVHGYVSVCYGTGRGEWCDSMVPSLFAYAQAHYWNNGFLKYWTLGNVPNFLFAAPTVLFSVLSVRYFAYMYPVARVVPVLVVNVAYIFLQCLFWHVQIVTRVHTFLPIVYWLVAGLATQGNTYGRKWAHVALTYFVVWNVCQVALFAAFLPPA